MREDDIMLLKCLTKDQAHRKINLDAMVRRLGRRVDTERNQHTDWTVKGGAGNIGDILDATHGVGSGGAEV